MYKQEANKEATNSELDAKIIVKNVNQTSELTTKNDNKKDEYKVQYDKIPKRY